MIELSQDELLRYARHMIMPEVGRSGQERLKNSSVVVVGAGGLGSPAAYYLAAAGVGRLGIVDFDAVDRTNLHRQILHFDTDVGKSKTKSASDKLSALNPTVEVIQHNEKLTSENAMRILGEYDVVVDGSDNFPTRYLVNDACVLLGKPNVYGAIFRFEGQASVLCSKGGPCYRCLYPEPPHIGEVPSCAEAGVFGVLPGVVGCIQATEAIKLLLQIGQPLVGTLLCFDALSMDFRKFDISKTPACPVCGVEPTIVELIDYEEFCDVRRPQSVPVPMASVHYVSELINNRRDFTLLDVREQTEVEIARIPRSVHIPMNQVGARLDELDKEKETIVMCHTGSRSKIVAELLIQNGFPNVKNLEGGIDTWASEIDPSTPRY